MAAADALELVVGWLPSFGLRLSDSAPSLKPALLYADRVVIVSPESDDALEMFDYFEFQAAAPDVVEFISLSSGQSSSTGSLEPVLPDVYESEARRYGRLLNDALAANDARIAIDTVARALALGWGVHEFDALPLLREEAPSLDSALLRQAHDYLDQEGGVRRAATADLIAAAFSSLTNQPAKLGVLDDPTGTLVGALRDRSDDSRTRWVQMRAREAEISAQVIRTLPSLDHQSWDVIGDVRTRLEPSLHRFRSVMARLASTLDVDVVDSDFDEALLHTIRVEVNPALDELEELARAAEFRSVFFEDVLGDLKTYAGGAFAIAGGATHSLGLFTSALVGAAPAAAGTIAHVRNRRQALRRHNYIFMHELAQRTQRRSWRAPKVSPQYPAAGG